MENPSGTISGPEERASDHEEDDGLEPNPSVSGIFIHFKFVNSSNKWIFGNDYLGTSYSLT